MLINRILLIGLCFLLILGWAEKLESGIPKQDDNYRHESYTTIEGYRASIFGIQFGSKESQVIQMLGLPIKMEHTNGNKEYYNSKTLYYDGLEIILLDKDNHYELSDMTCSNSKYPIYDGLRIGDSKEDILKTYGLGDLWTEKKETIINYDIQDHEDQTLTFTLKDDKITEMSLWTDDS